MEGWGNTPVGRPEGAPCPYHNKTTIALATIDLMGAYPAIVVCPPHLVNKWRREAEDVIPGVQTRELSRIGKTASMAHEVNDVRAFVEDWNAGRLGDKDGLGKKILEAYAKDLRGHLSRHARAVLGEIRRLTSMAPEEMMAYAKEIAYCAY